MTQERHDPWALLREAQGWIGYWPLTKPEAGAEAIKKRIDAALAAHDAVPSSEETVWHMTGGPIGTLTADLGDWVLRVRWDGQDAAWDATRYGREADEKKAKSAAIAAARGMR